MLDVKDYAELALKESIKECDQAEVLTLTTIRRRLLLEDNKVNYVEFSKNSRIRVMVIRDKKIGVVSRSGLSKPNVYETISRALELMRNSEPDPDFETLISPMKLSEVGAYFDKNILELSDEELIDRGTDVIKVVESKNGIITQGELELSTSTLCLLNSEGVDVCGRRTNIAYNFTLMVSEDTNASEGFLMRGYTFLEDAKLESDIEWMLDLTRRTTRVKKVEGGLLDVVLGPDALYELLRYTLPYALNGDHARKHRSPFTGRLNSQIFSENLTIIDDGTLPKGYATFPCDGEGHPMRRKTVVDRGILKTFLLDHYTAVKVGVESTGNAGTNRPFPSISPTNLIIAHGNKSIEELIGEIDKGLYIPRIPPAMVNPLTGQFSVELRQAFRIERGEIGEAVRWGMLSDNVYGMLNRIISISRTSTKIYNFIVPAISISNTKIEA